MGKEAVDYVLSNSRITNLNDVKELLKDGPDEVLKVMIHLFISSLNSKSKADEYSKRLMSLLKLNLLIHNSWE